jgi:hypothetical protein
MRLSTEEAPRFAAISAASPPPASQKNQKFAHLISRGRLIPMTVVEDPDSHAKK